MKRGLNMDYTAIDKKLKDLQIKSVMNNNSTNKQHNEFQKYEELGHSLERFIQHNAIEGHLNRNVMEIVE